MTKIAIVTMTSEKDAKSKTQVLKITNKLVCIRYGMKVDCICFIPTVEAL
jgi:hypothetical protein